MSENNMNLWNAVCVTDPTHTKKVSYGARKFTAIDAQYQIQTATEQWGSFGKEWGIESEQFEIIAISSKWLLAYNAQFYYPGGKFPIHSSMNVISTQGMLDDDCYKKIATDALTKGLSKLGFNADVFLGKFDGNKYVGKTTQSDTQPKTTPVKTENPHDQKIVLTLDEKKVQAYQTLKVKTEPNSQLFSNWNENIKNATAKNIDSIIKTINMLKNKEQ